MSTTGVTLHLPFILLVVGVVLLPRRRAAVAGTALAGWMLGAGAFAAVPGVVAIAPLAARLGELALSPVFVGVNVGLMLLAAAVVGGIGLRAVSDEDAALPRAAGLTAAVLAIAALALLLPLLRVAGLAAALAAGGIAGTVALVRVAVQEVGWTLGRAAASLWSPRPGPVRRRRAPGGAGRAAAVAAAIGGLAVLTVPHALVVVGAALVVAVAAHVAARAVGQGPAVPVLPLVALALVPFAWLLATIAGPVGLSLGVLPNAPLSPPAQALLVPLLIVGAWPFLGLWPLHRWVPGPMLAPVSGALLLRVGVPALGAGIEHLQPALFAAGAAALWHAALTRRAAGVLSALGFVAFAATAGGSFVAPDARIAAAVLFAGAFAAAALERLFATEAGAGVWPGAVRRTAFVASRAVVLAAAVAAQGAISAGLRVEVVLTVAVTAGAAMAAWRLRRSEGRVAA